MVRLDLKNVGREACGRGNSQVCLIQPSNAIRELMRRHNLGFVRLRVEVYHIPLCNVQEILHLRQNRMIPDLIMVVIRDIELVLADWLDRIRCPE